MNKFLKICAIIPARKGSTRLPNKHLLSINKKYLISYTFDEVIKSNFINRIICSTDDKNIINLKKNKRIDFPYVRPKFISSNKTKTEDVIIHLLNFLKKRENYVPDIIVLLQATSPLRKINFIDDSIKKFLKNKYDSLISIKKTNQIFFNIHDKLLNLIDSPKNILQPNGAIYISKTKVFLKNKSFISKKTFGYKMSKISSLDIDTEKDLEIFKKYLNKKKH